MSRHRLSLLTCLVGLSLSSCQSRDGGEVQDNDIFDSTIRYRDGRFGDKVAEAASADPMSEPKKISRDDLPPPSLTAEPLPVN